MKAGKGDVIWWKTYQNKNRETQCRMVPLVQGNSTKNCDHLYYYFVKPTLVFTIQQPSKRLPTLPLKKQVLTMTKYWLAFCEALLPLKCHNLFLATAKAIAQGTKTGSASKNTKHAQLDRQKSETAFDINRVTNETWALRIFS